MIVGCNLDVPGIAGAQQGSVLVMTDADWAGDVKDRRSYSGIAVWIKGSAENTWYPVYASSKKQNVVCLSSSESELMTLVGGACEGIATRDQWSKMCNCPSGTTAALGFVKRKGASRLKVHGDSQQVADYLTKIMTPQVSSSSTGSVTDCSILSYNDERRAEHRRPQEHCICHHFVHDHVSHHHEHEVWYDFTTRCLCTLKSGDKLISLKETCGSCEGKSRTTFITSR